MNIYQKLNEARKRFHASKLEKTGWNPYSEFKYFELADFILPALDIFQDLGLCEYCSFTPEMASMTIINIENPEEKIVLTAPFSSAKLKASHEIQNVGACETYHRRYFWIAALEIVEHDVLDKTIGKGSMAASGPGESFKELPPEIQQAFRRAVHTIIGKPPKEQIDAIEMLLDEWPDGDRNMMKAGFWSLLDSKTRSAITKYVEQEKA